MTTATGRNDGKWGIKPLLLACIIPIFIGASVIGIVSNYLMARKNANERIQDHILQRRMDLVYLANLPSLRMYMVDLRLGLDEEAAFLREDVQNYLVEYLKTSLNSVPYTFSLISRQGKEILRVKDGTIEPAVEDFSKSPSFARLKDGKGEKDLPLPAFSGGPGNTATLSDMLPIRDEINKMTLGGIVFSYRLPIAQFMAPAHDTLVFNLALNAGIAFIAITMIYIALVIITNPLKHLTRASQKMLGGDLSGEIRIDALGDETQTLASTFEAMRQQLKRQIEQLQENARNLENIIDFLPDATFIIDKDGKVIFWNKAIEEMTGCPRETMLGKNDHEYALPFYGERRPVLIDFSSREKAVTTEESEELDALIERYFKFKRMGNTIKGYSWCPALRGGKRLLSGTASGLYDERGNLWGAIECLRDVTENYEMETEKEHLQVQLYQAQKMEAIGTLAGGIAHDFNNLLQIISGYTQLLLFKTGEDFPERGKLVTIKNSTEKATKLIRQLLLFSRKLKSELKPVDLNAEIRQTLDLLENTLPASIEIGSELGQDLKPILADPVQLEQMIMNLAINATDAMPNGGRLFLQTRLARPSAADIPETNRAVSDEYVMLTVSDTGQGISKEIQEHIFEPFFTTKDIGKGTGLGLSMIYGAMKNHRGWITCRSELGKGTHFDLYFPVAGNGRPETRSR